METCKFKRGDIVVFTPSKETLEFIDKNPGYKEYIGEKAIVLSSVYYVASISTVHIQYMSTIGTIAATKHTWYNKDLTLVSTEREFSGEV